jgi:recombination associated protein RdgC
MFKNAVVYQLGKLQADSADSLARLLETMTFQDPSSIQMSSEGWRAPHKGGGLVHSIGGQYLMEFAIAKKLLTAAAINEVVEARAEELEDQQGFPPGRKQRKELKEQVIDELLPKAFTVTKKIQVWIDPINGWVAVDTSSTSKAEAVIAAFYKCIPNFPIKSLRTMLPPSAAMTDWLARDEAPEGFTVDQEAELRSPGEGKATVKFLRHTLDVADMRKHIEEGKQCIRLALTWADKISFILTDALTIKRLALLEVLKEGGEIGNDGTERADSDFALMTGELNKLFGSVIGALGGAVPDDDA